MLGSRPLGFGLPTFDNGEAERYLEDEGLIQWLEGSHIQGQIPPELSDLARLHRLVSSRRVFTVLEFGVGWSTIVLAAAIQRNKEQWERLERKPQIRSDEPFKVISVDASQEWLQNAEGLIPEHLRPLVTLCHSETYASDFLGRACHFYQDVPDIVPDFIYLDGPDPKDVSGTVNGLSWMNPDRTVCAGDILIMESTLLPGTCVLVDGRSNNARFLINNLQRHWGTEYDRSAEVTALELQEPPLGALNERRLRYCLGEEYFERVDSLGAMSRGVT